MGVPRAASLCGSKGFLLLQAFFFCLFFVFGTPTANSGRVSWTEVVVAVALRRAAQTTAASAL